MSDNWLSAYIVRWHLCRLVSQHCPVSGLPLVCCSWFYWLPVIQLRVLYMYLGPATVAARGDWRGLIGLDADYFLGPSTKCRWLKASSQCFLALTRITSLASTANSAVLAAVNITALVSIEWPRLSCYRQAVAVPGQLLICCGVAYDVRSVTVHSNNSQ